MSTSSFSSTPRKLVLILDARHWQELRQRQELSHDAGRLLKWSLERLSIPRESWTHCYCYQGQKSDLPPKKADRLKRLAMDWEKVEDVIRLNEPCVLVGLGKLACEFLTGSSQLKEKAGTNWRSSRSPQRVWISYSTDAALFDPAMIVEIYGVLAKAALAAGIEIKLNTELKMFDWSPFHVVH